MKDFDNYECDGQMEFADLYPKTCCGLIPWLEKSKCCRWNDDQPQKWLLNYICPKCFKRAVDDTGWPLEGHGTFEEAKAQALAFWNDPNNRHEVCEVAKELGISLHISLGEVEEWEKLYEVDLDGSYIGKL